MPLGKKIRDLRLRRSLTVQQLAEKSGLSKGFISQVENHRTSPSLATLRDLAHALDTSVAYLVVDEDQVPCVVRASERSALEGLGRGSRVQLLSALPKRNLEMVLLDLAVGVEAGEQRHEHHGEECLLCLSGRVRLICGEYVIALEAGDSCHYDGRMSHVVENCGPVPAQVLIAMTPAGFGTAVKPREPHVLETEAPIPVEALT